MNEKNVVIVLGAVGTGKSSLINILSGKNLATVSNEYLGDGTTGFLTIQSATSPHLYFVDTPGLDSGNVPNSSTIEHLRKSHVKDKVHIFYLISTQARRKNLADVYFDKIRDSLLGSETFTIIWTMDGDAPIGMKTELAGKYATGVRFFKSVDIEGISAVLNDASLFKSIVGVSAAPANVLPPPPKATNIANKPTTQSNKKNKIKTPSTIFTCPETFATVEGFKSVKKNSAGLQEAIDEVLEVKRTNTVEFDILCEMGDAKLKPFVHSYLYHILGERAELNRKTTDIISAYIQERSIRPMPLFFDQNIKAKFDQKFPTEADALSAHRKADIVEALMEHLFRKKKSASLLKHVLMTLCVSLNTEMV